MEYLFKVSLTFIGKILVNIYDDTRELCVRTEWQFFPHEELNLINYYFYTALNIYFLESKYVIK